jgi:hypothetical protein
MRLHAVLPAHPRLSGSLVAGMADPQAKGNKARPGRAVAGGSGSGVERSSGEPATAVAGAMDANPLVDREEELDVAATQDDAEGGPLPRDPWSGPWRHSGRGDLDRPGDSRSRCRTGKCESRGGAGGTGFRRRHYASSGNSQRDGNVQSVDRSTTQGSEGEVSKRFSEATPRQPRLAAGGLRAGQISVRAAAPG